MRYKRKGDKIEKWEVVEKIGQGGNGVVYKVTDGKNKYALKTLLKFSQTKSYSRFRDEVEALYKGASIKGVIDIIEHHLPEKPSEKKLPFYIMPVGEQIESYLNDKRGDILFEAFLKIANAIIQLHKLDLTHRDIKSNNILVIDDEPVLVDFGLASFPEKETQSKINENIGAKWTIAPEMQRSSSTAEFKKADIYSLAKTLWVLITKQSKGFEGQYIKRSSISIDKYVDVLINKNRIAGEWNYFSTVLLDKLFMESTDNEPNNRPNAEQFYQRLDFWLSSNSKYEERNVYEWEEALNIIFPYGIPNECCWSASKSILEVISELTKYDNLNHCFYPESGGMDIVSIRYLEAIDNFIINERTLFKAKELIFKYLEDYSWAYFRLEIENQKEILETNEGKRKEYIIVDEDGEFIQEDSGESEVGVSVIRQLDGSFNIVRKQSPINLWVKGEYRGIRVDGYSAFHEKVSTKEYEEVMRYIKENTNI